MASTRNDGPGTEGCSGRSTRAPTHQDRPRQPHPPPLPPRPHRRDETTSDSRASHPAPAGPDRLTDSTRADERDDGHTHDFARDDEPDAATCPAERERQCGDERTSRGVDKATGGSGDEGVAGGVAGEHGKVVVSQSPKAARIAALILSKSSDGSEPSFRSKRVLGNEPMACTFAVDSGLRK